MLGTTAFCAVIPIIFSFIPYRYLRRVFPPVVTSSTIMLIGINLTGAGMGNWGGGERLLRLGNDRCSYRASI